METQEQLRAKRRRCEIAIANIESAMQDIRKYQKDGATDAGWAATIAATMMVVDIVKHGVAAVDKRADYLFKAIDHFSHRDERMKALLDSVDSPLRGARSATDFVENAKKWDKRANNSAKFFLYANRVVHYSATAAKTLRHVKKVTTISEPLSLTIDIGIDMANDSLLMMSAMMTQQGVQTSGDAAWNNSLRQLNKVKLSLIKVNDQIARIERERAKPENGAAAKVPGAKSNVREGETKSDHAGPSQNRPTVLP
jgi:hypothetical protein